MASFADPITFSDLEQTYDGSPKSPTLLLDPPDLAVRLRYLPVGAPLPPAPVIFRRGPDLLAPSYQSLSFSAQQTLALGELIRFDDTPPPAATEIDVVLVTWAKAADYTAWSSLDSEGWEHPVTLWIYSADATNNLTLIASKVQPTFIPWRPLVNPDGSPYTKNGFAFRATFQFETPVVLAPRTMVMVSFNTQNTGFDPVGLPGPYNELNTALYRAAPDIGIDDNPDGVLWVQSGSPDPIWSYPSTGFSGVGFPMFRVTGVAPDPSTSTPPIPAGDYLVTALAEHDGGTVEASTPFTILPAQATVEIGDTVRVGDGSPQPVSIQTSPPGLAVTVLYSGGEAAPSGFGLYPVQATIDDPNHVGQAEDILVIGHDLASWTDMWMAEGSLPAGFTGPLDDPDEDLLVNELEYAFGLNPGRADGNVVVAGKGEHGNGFSLIYPRNLLATDLNFMIHATENPGDPESWEVTPTTNIIESTTPEVQIIRATLPGGLTAPKRFARIEVARVPAGPE